jgi:hypothetical protein
MNVAVRPSNPLSPKYVTGISNAIRCTRQKSIAVCPNTGRWVDDQQAVTGPGE